MDMTPADSAHHAATLLAALAAPDRIRVLGEITRHGAEGADIGRIAAALDLPVRATGEACARLVAAGVVSASHGRYAHRLAGLREAADALDHQQPVNALLPAYPRLRGLFSHGKLVSIPPVYSDAFWALAEMAARFVALEGTVDEPEINRRLAPMTDDVAKLRRMLVDTGWPHRDRADAAYSPGASLRPVTAP